MKHLHIWAILLGIIMLFGLGTGAGAEELVRISKIKNRQVLLPDGETGELSTVLFDPQTGVVGFAVVSKGGVFGLLDEEIVVPWPALDMLQDGSFRVEKGVSPSPKPETMTMERVTDIYQAAGLEDRIANARQRFEARACAADWTCERLLELERVAFYRIRLREDGQNVGLVRDILIDPVAGQVLLLVMERGAYFFRWVETTVAGNLVLLPWPSVAPVQDLDILIAKPDQDELSGVSVYRPEESLDVDLNRAEKIYSHFGYDTYWKTLREGEK